jgi:hypothetical protein
MQTTAPTFLVLVGSSKQPHHRSAAQWQQHWQSGGHYSRNTQQGRSTPCQSQTIEAARGDLTKLVSDSHQCSLQLPPPPLSVAWQSQSLTHLTNAAGSREPATACVTAIPLPMHHKYSPPPRALPGTAKGRTHLKVMKAAGSRDPATACLSAPPPRPSSQAQSSTPHPPPCPPPLHPPGSVKARTHSNVTNAAGSLDPAIACTSAMRPPFASQVQSPLLPCNYLAESRPRLT